MQLTIYHTNDLHSHFDKLAQISEYIRKNRKPGDLYLDSGDLCDRSDYWRRGQKGRERSAFLKVLERMPWQLAIMRLTWQKNY